MSTRMLPRESPASRQSAAPPGPSRTVRTVLLGPGGAADCLLAGLSRGSILVDMSSSSPLGTRELGARLAERGVARSEERRVGKECRSRWSPYHLKEKKKNREKIKYTLGVMSLNKIKKTKV